MTDDRVGQYLVGRVSGIEGYGFFVSFDDTSGSPYQSGLVYISQIANGYIQNVHDYVSLNDVVLVKVIPATTPGKMSLSLKKVSKEQKINLLQYLEKQYGTLDFTATVTDIFSDCLYLKLENGLKCLLRAEDFDWQQVSDFETIIELHSRIDIRITGYSVKDRVLLVSRKERLPRPWIQYCQSEKDIKRTGRINEIHLNGATIAMDGIGSVVVPFSDFLNYHIGDEKRIIPETRVDILIQNSNKSSVAQPKIRVISNLFSGGKAYEKRLRIAELTSKRCSAILIGSTGSGKSSIINAIREISGLDKNGGAEIGLIEPTTKSITPYKIKELTLWDTPGLGESPSKDIETIESITKWLFDHKAQNPLIVVVLNASVRDYGSIFVLLRSICTENLEKFSFLFVLNRVDTLFKPKYFEHLCKTITSLPQNVRQKIIDKEISIQTRIKDSVGLQGDVISVSAGNGEQSPIGITKLLEKMYEGA